MDIKDLHKIEHEYKDNYLPVDKEEEITIEYLNDDCLIYIFEHLTVKEKLRFERVCKRWDRVLKLCWNQTKSLIVDVDNEDILLKGKSFKNSKNMITNFLLSILRNSSSYLNNLKLSCIYIKEYLEFERFLEELPEYCNNLTHLSLTGFNGNSTSYFTDDYLKELFSKAANLSSIYIRYMVLNGDCFINLFSNKIKEFSLNTCQITNKQILYSFISKLTNLNKFEIVAFEEETISKVLDSLLESECKNIREFHLDPPYTFHPNLSILLSKQKEIQKLSLQGVQIVKKLMKSIPTDHLKILDLGLFCNNSDKIFLKYLYRFKNLQVFKADIETIYNDTLQILSKNLNKNVKKIDVYFDRYSLTVNPISCFKNFQQLEYFALGINSCYEDNLSMDYVLKDISECKNLKFLDLKNIAFTNSVLKTITENLPKLEKLSIDDYSDDSDDDVSEESHSEETQSDND